MEFAILHYVECGPKCDTAQVVSNADDVSIADT